MICISKADREEFTIWLRECCGVDIDTLDDYEMRRAYDQWMDECFRAANPECFDE